MAINAKDSASIQSGLVVIEGLSGTNPESLTEDDMMDTLGLISTLLNTSASLATAEGGEADEMEEHADGSRLLLLVNFIDKAS